MQLGAVVVLPLPISRAPMLCSGELGHRLPPHPGEPPALVSSTFTHTVKTHGVLTFTHTVKTHSVLSSILDPGLKLCAFGPEVSSTLRTNTHFDYASDMWEGVL